MGDVVFAEELEQELAKQREAALAENAESYYNQFI